MEISAKGLNGTVSFDGQFVTIKRSGFFAATTTGLSEKRIPLSKISAVQWKPGTRLSNGYIAFTIGGGKEKQSRLGSQYRDSLKDENTVALQRKHTADMQQVRDAIDEAIIASETGTTAPAASGADEVARLATLHQQGVLTDEEFAAAKARALGL